MKKILLKKNLPLSISIPIVLSAALTYGFFPQIFIHVDTNTMDEANILKAIMGLYLAFASLWIIGVYNEKYWKTATTSNMLFMFGLGFGRIISMICDGIPSTIFVFGTIAELILGFYALVQIKKYSNI